MEDKNEFTPESDAFWENDDMSLPDASDVPADETDFVDSFFTDDPASEPEIPSEMPAMESLYGEVYPSGDAADMDDTRLFTPAAPSDLPLEPTLEQILADYEPDLPTEDVPSDPYDIPAPSLSVDEAFRATDESAEEFQNLMEEQTKEDPIPHRKHKRTKKIPRKGRPKRRKGDGLFGLPHLLATAVWLAIVLAIGVTLGKLLWVGAADVLAFGRENKPVTVTILDSDDLDTIAQKLSDAGLVKYPELFKLYAKITGSDEEIISGYFELNTILDYHALSNALSPSSSNRTVTEVMIPEGYNCRQIFELLEQSNICSVSSLEEYAANGAFSDFWFLEGLERGDRYCLEGYLFPDTYEFYVNSTPREALGKMLTGFDNRFTGEMREQITALNTRFAEMMRKNGCSEEYIAGNTITVRELVIIASMIEEETASSSESASIASVIYNRLAGKEVYERYLNIDASIYYALGGNIDPETGKVKALTSEDLKIDSPYNTYTNAGLTPTPISNPGLASLQAALDPLDTDYYYYVLNPETRLHQFSKTYEEHQKWVEQFRTVEDNQ